MKRLLILLFSLSLLISCSESDKYVKRGSAKLQIGHVEEARADFAKAIELDPDNIEAYKGRAFTSSGKEAIADWTKVINSEPNKASNYIERAMDKRNIKDYKGAIADYTKVIELQPTAQGCFYSRGICKVEMGEVDGGCRDLYKATELEPLKKHSPDPNGLYDVSEKLYGQVNTDLLREAIWKYCSRKD